MTFLQLVNSVLRRLRESEVSSVNENSYSKLIGEFVNQTKREVEDAYNWNVLTESLTLITAPDLFNYVMTGAGSRFRVLDVLNVSDQCRMRPASRQQLNTYFLPQPNPKGSPYYYGWNGVSSDGDYQVDLFPIPDGVYELRFNVINPQPMLSDDSDILMVPYDPVVLGAYAKAIRERGEDGGNAAAEVQAQYAAALGTAVAQENARFTDETDWYLV